MEDQDMPEEGYLTLEGDDCKYLEGSEHGTFGKKETKYLRADTAVKKSELIKKLENLLEHTMGDVEEAIYDLIEELS